MQKIVPNVWFAGDAEEAGAFYSAVLPRTTSAVTMRYPETGLPDFQRPLAGRPLTVAVDVEGYRIVLINAGDEYRPNPSLSFLLNFDTSRDPDAREELDGTWTHLAERGRVLLPLEEQEYSPWYGWVEDRHGVSWQLILTDDEGEARPFVMPALLFGGPAQGRGHEALEYYVGALPDARLGSVVESRTSFGGLLFGELAVGDQWVVAMDAGVPQDETFTPGVSLEITGRDQAEVDRLWEALSAVPEAERCGWCVDRFGVSWQVVPEGLVDLVRHPAGYAAMLEMTKLDLAALRRAVAEAEDPPRAGRS